MTTSVPGMTFTDRGFVEPTEQAVLTGVQTDIDVAFGGGVNPALNTPQGQLATSLTAIIGEANDTFVRISNEFDPAYASGRWQDAIARIYFLTRNPSEPTSLQILCVGGQNVVIPAVQAKVIDQLGNIYLAVDGGTISPTGNVTLSFAAAIPGPTAVPGTVSIFGAIPGWDSASVSSGVVGKNTESRADFEARRAASVALNSRGSLPSIQGAILDVAGVLDSMVVENVTNSPLTVLGATLAAHSIYASVIGGASADVAKAIWSRKAPGCNYNGNTTVTVFDDNSGYTPPFPSYNVSFEIPPALPFIIRVEINNNSLVPSTGATQIQNAVLNAFNGVDGGARARIGTKMFASRFYAPVSLLGSWAEIVSILLGTTATNSAQFTASLASGVLTVTAVSSGTILLGDTLSNVAGTIAAGTRVISQSSGTPGGIGVYVITLSQTVVSGTFFSSTANANDEVVNINQVPTLDISNIQVVLT